MGEQIEGLLEILDESTTNSTIAIDGNSADVSIGGNGQHGDLSITDSGGRVSLRVSGQGASLIIGGTEKNGDIHVRNNNDRTVLRVAGATGRLILGTSEAGGHLDIRNSDGRIVLEFRSDHGLFELMNQQGSRTIIINSEQASLSMGIRDKPGQIIIRNGLCREALQFNCDSRRAHLVLGGEGQAGSLTINDDENGDNRFSFNGVNGQVQFFRNQRGESRRTFLFNTQYADLRVRVKITSHFSW